MKLVSIKLTFLIGTIVWMLVHSAVAATSNQEAGSDDSPLRGFRNLQKNGNGGGNGNGNGGGNGNNGNNGNGNNGNGPPDDKVQKFKERNTLKANAKPKFKKFKEDFFEIDDQSVSLANEDLFPVEGLFSPGAKFLVNGEEQSELPRLFRSKKDPFIKIAKGKDGALQWASKKGSNGQSKNVLPLEPTSDFFTTISSDDIDMDAVEQMFKYADAPPVAEEEGGTRLLHFLRSSLTEEPEVDADGSRFIEKLHQGLVGEYGGGDQVQRDLQTCTDPEVIEVAIAFDSTFCDDYANFDAASNAAASVVDDVSLMYQQANLCKQVQISYLEGFCNNVNDPYTGMVQASSVCGGSDPLLSLFRSYWNSNRGSISRDTAHLFYGTNTGGSGVIGCAWLDALCSSVGYGVNWITYTMNTNLQATLFAHELGHNAGADHDSINDFFIMRPSICDCDTFSSSSFTQILQHIDSVNSNGGDCITADTSPPTAPPPTQPPPTSTQAPPTQAPPTQAPPTQAPPTSSPPGDFCCSFQNYGFGCIFEYCNQGENFCDWCGGVWVPV